MFDKDLKSQIRGIFSDLDDTMTENGYLPSSVVQAIEQLKAKSLKMVIVSGRPAGWADCLMRLLPLDAMIFENGAGLMIREGKKVRLEHLAADLDFVAQMERLEEVFQKIKKEIPEAKLATDQAYRLFDYAVDFNEEPPFLDAPQVEKILKMLESEKGITAKLSSIHVNYWCGSHTKVTAAEHLIQKYGKPWGLERGTVLFSGDSPNDEPLFQFFNHSVGVRNVEKYLPRMQHHPKYITQASHGSGFVEMVNQLLR